MREHVSLMSRRRSPSRSSRVTSSQRKARNPFLQDWSTESLGQTSGVYVVLHLPTGYTYVGITSQPLLQRWRNHLRSMRRTGSLFQRFLYDHPFPSEYVVCLLEKFPFDRGRHLQLSGATRNDVQYFKRPARRERRWTRIFRSYTKSLNMKTGTARRTNGWQLFISNRRSLQRRRRPRHLHPDGRVVHPRRLFGSRNWGRRVGYLLGLSRLDRELALDRIMSASHAQNTIYRLLGHAVTTLDFLRRFPNQSVVYHTPLPSGVPSQVKARVVQLCRTLEDRFSRLHRQNMNWTSTSTLQSQRLPYGALVLPFVDGLVHRRSICRAIRRVTHVFSCETGTSITSDLIPRPAFKYERTLGSIMINRLGPYSMSCCSSGCDSCSCLHPVLPMGTLVLREALTLHCLHDAIEFLRLGANFRMDPPKPRNRTEALALCSVS